MMTEGRLTPTAKYYMRLVMVPLLLMTTARLVFWLWFKGSESTALPKELVYAFYLGLKFDLRLALLLILPPFVLGWISPLNASNWSSFGRRLWTFYWVFALSIILICYCIDFAYYSYLGIRINATAIRFLLNPTISAIMIWQSYPVIPCILGVILFAYCYKVIMQRYVFNPVVNAIVNVSLQKTILTNSILAVAIVAGLYGNFSFYPLRWSQAYFSNNSFVSALSLNPILYFYDTYHFRSAGYDKKIVKKYYAEVANYLGVRNQDIEKLNFSRVVEPSRNLSVPPNILIIIMESLAYYKTGLSGSTANATPHVDELGENGRLYTKFYVPSEGTARSIFSLLTGTPDINGRKTSTRNPIIVSQHLIANAFTDYRKFYFIGGSASWGNIRGLLSHNIPDLELIEEGQFKRGRTDVWGLSDYDLFVEAHERLATVKNKPFFAVIQTAGFHRPYTIPKDNGGYQQVELSEKNLEINGFVSNEELNSLRFADHGLGNFIKLARSEPYFENTLVVVIGDHGLPDHKAKHLTRGHIYHGLERWHVPLIFYGPSFFSEPTRINSVASELDIMTTLASFAGVRHTNTTLGRDLFDPQFDESRYAFLFTYYNQPPGIGLIGEKFHMRCVPGKCQGLFEYGSATPEAEISRNFPEKALEMITLTQGLYESAKYLLYHNPNPLVSQSKQ